MCEVVEAMLVQEAVTLSVDGHGLPDDLVNIGEGLLAIPRTESRQYVYIFQLVNDSVEL